jgi:predicted transcriptional regulator
MQTEAAMATTTTIRLPEDLKARIATAAERAGKTTHSFILEAIAEKAELEEQRANFDAEADARFSKIVESGKTIPWTDMRHYLEERLAGKQVQRPIAKKNQA